jgi:hypothetical protein
VAAQYTEAPDDSDNSPVLASSSRKTRDKPAVKEEKKVKKAAIFISKVLYRYIDICNVMCLSLNSVLSTMLTYTDCCYRRSACACKRLRRYCLVYEVFPSSYLIY